MFKKTFFQSWEETHIFSYIMIVDFTSHNNFLTQPSPPSFILDRLGCTGKKLAPQGYGTAGISPTGLEPPTGVRHRQQESEDDSRG